MVDVNDNRIEIADMAVNSIPYLDRLKSDGVRVIARYYARAKQKYLPEKRLAYNSVAGKTETEALLEKEFSIITVYQFASNQRRKFVAGLDGKRGPAGEARLDAMAALEQAHMTGQKKGSTIYFGVDFNLLPDDDEAVEGVITYFKVINQELSGKYAVGAYGNGLSQMTLRNHKLISQSWLSASVGHTMTDEFFNSGAWSMFQNQIDRHWYTNNSCPSGLGLDTNVANPALNDIGAWGTGYRPDGRTKNIFDHRRFAKTNVNIRNGPGKQYSKIDKRRCRYINKKWQWVREDRAFYARNVRFGKVIDGWLEVDVDDDGHFDGYAAASLFTDSFGQMPLWKDRP